MWLATVCAVWGHERDLMSGLHSQAISLGDHKKLLFRGFLSGGSKCFPVKTPPFVYPGDGYLTVPFWEWGNGICQMAPILTCELTLDLPVFSQAAALLLLVESLNLEVLCFNFSREEKPFSGRDIIP